MATNAKPVVQAKVRLSPNGRVVIPASIRHELGFKSGDSLYLDIEDGSLRIETYEARLHRIQESIRKYIPEGVSLADELIAERREEARRELEEAEQEINQENLRKAGLLE